MSAIADLVKERAARAPAERYCFTCACGHQTFVLRPDAKVQCGYCLLIQPRLIWGEFFRSETINPPDHPPEF